MTLLINSAYSVNKSSSKKLFIIVIFGSHLWLSNLPTTNFKTEPGIVYQKQKKEDLIMENSSFCICM